MGGRRREAQQLLGRERDERLARALVGLRAQHVEVVCRRGGLDDPHVVLGGQLQVALDARARVVGSLALVAVGQEHDERGTLAPLLLGRAHELVDDGLRTVREVAELCLPDRQGLGALHRVAVVEGQHAVFAQRGVPHVEARLVLGEEAQRGELASVIRVVQDRVTLHEGRAAHVLTGQAYAGALHEERAECEELRKAPVDRLVAQRHLQAALAQLTQLRVGLEALGEARVCASNATQLLGGGRRRPADHHAGSGHLGLRHGPFPVGGLPGLADAGGERGVVRAAARVDLGHGRSTARAGLLEDAPEFRLVLGDRLAGLVLGELTATHEAADVHGARGGDAVDEGVHDGLGHRRVVALVVTATAVAHHVDDDVFVEGVAVLEGQVCAADDGLGVVCVHVQDRDL